MQLKSLRITSTIIADQTTAEAEFLVRNAVGGWRPEAGNEMIISTTSDTVRHFAGNIIRVGERASNKVDLLYSVSAKDYTWLFDRRMVTTTYDSSSGAAIIADIVNNYTTGFTTGGIQNLGNIAQQRLDYVYPSDAIRSIADQQSAHWYIDFNKVVQYFSAISNIAPTTGINFDTNTADYGDLVLSEDASNVKNRIIVQGYQKASTVQFSRNFTGDGATRFFGLGYQPSGLAASQMTVTVDGVAQTLLYDTIDGSPGNSEGGANDMFVCFDNMGIRKSTGVAAPSSTVVVLFNYMLDGGVQVDDAAAQSEMASRSSGDGVHMFMVQDPSMTNLAANDDLALALGNALTTRYGQPSLEGQFKSYLQGWRAGQYLTGTSARRMGGFTQTFYVHRVDKSLVSHPSGGSPTWVHDVFISNSSLPY
mgnify:FL=1